MIVIRPKSYHSVRWMKLKIYKEDIRLKNIEEALEILGAKTLQGEKHYRYKCSPKNYHHFICNDCGSNKQLPICTMDEDENLLGGYTIKDHKFEVYGLCPECQIA